ncbi:Glycerol-3-phosphate acyltransferase 3 [Asimina triloba]
MQGMNVRFAHQFREGNQVADFLAKLGESGSNRTYEDLQDLLRLLRGIVRIDKSGREMALKAMVMVSFLGIRKEGFMVGRAVLPKYFLEDVGLEGYEVLKRGGRRVGVSEMPRVMVEGFLKDYMGVEVVLGRELKVVCGYYVGLMEEKGK